MISTAYRCAVATLRRRVLTTLRADFVLLCRRLNNAIILWRMHRALAAPLLVTPYGTCCALSFCGVRRHYAFTTRFLRTIGVAGTLERRDISKYALSFI